MPTTVPIFYATDEKYAPFLSVSLTSLIANTDPTADTTYRILIVHRGLSEESQQLFRQMATDRIAIELYPMESYLIEAINSDRNKLNADYVTMTIYFRLFLSEMFPEIDKAIYLDADTIINADIAQLYRIDLGHDLIAAVADNFVAANPETVYYSEEGLGIPCDQYVNSGMLLMNLKAMREGHFTERFVQLLNKYHFESIAPDQDYLNVMCNGRIHYLDRRWNNMTGDGTEGPDHPRIIHYNLFGKPWHYRDAPLADYFWRYAEGSAYYPKLIAILKEFSQRDPSFDDKRKATMMTGAVSIPKNEVTFKKVAESGVDLRIR
ncbi:MAG: glycosyltransferase family 8 protein [Parascardovia denticolens]